ncbi:MAG: hypothetical protein JSV24_03435, partial [Bacteroidales bacterium]
MATKLTIDNKNVFTDYGVILVKSTGELDYLKYKKPYSHKWDDEHGEEVDLSERFFDSRKIVLDCLIKATSKSDFRAKMKNFWEFLSAPGLRMMLLPELPFAYMVYPKGGAKIEKLTKWNDTLMYGRVKITFEDPEPVSRQFTTDQDPLAQVQIQLTGTKVYTIYWGDGDIDTIGPGTDVSKTHDYSQTGDYQIVLTGDIDTITSLTPTNA